MLFNDCLESCFKLLKLIFEVGVFSFQVVEFVVEFLQTGEELIVSELQVVDCWGEFAVEDFELNDAFGEFVVSVFEVFVFELDCE